MYVSIGFKTLSIHHSTELNFLSKLFEHTRQKKMIAKKKHGPPALSLTLTLSPPALRN